MELSKDYFVEQEIEINANLQIVWKLISDWETYPKWNPFIIKIEKLKKNKNGNDKMKFTLRWGNGKMGTSIEEMVSKEYVENNYAELKYQYGALIAKLGLLKATRIHRLEQKNEKTKYYTLERFTGVLSKFLPLNSVKDGFQRQTEALAKKAEEISKR